MPPSPTTPTIDATRRATLALAHWHVTVVQHYDWMWRHYRYRPPVTPVTSSTHWVGRVSHDAVRAAIEAGHHIGIASLAYGSVYGAEAEYVDRHPDERVFDETGKPLSLGGVFLSTTCVRAARGAGASSRSTSGR